MATSRTKKILKYVGRVSMGIFSASLVLGSSPVSAIDSVEAASQVIGSEGGQAAAKEAINLLFLLNLLSALKSAIKALS